MALERALSLSELILHTASEIQDAYQKSSATKTMQFSGCELELAVSVKVEAGGGFKFWLVEASGKASGETSSKIRLSFGALSSGPLQFSATLPDDEGPAPPKRG